MSHIEQSKQKESLSTLQMSLLFAMRIVIGWHFLYEGIAKLLDPNWSAVGYLEVSRWWFAGIFQGIAANPTMMMIVDFVVIWALILIGLGLMLGLLTRVACAAGIALLFAFYICNPPITGLGLSVPTEGHYLFINKNLVELFALVALLAFPTGQWGLDRFIFSGKKRTTPTTDTSPDPESTPVQEEWPQQDRRAWLKGLAGVPFFGAFTWAVIRKEQWKSYEAQNLVEAVATASTKSLNIGSLGDLKGKLPYSQIKGVPFSRMILGGNLMSGWAHSRDLMYVSQLVKAYHTKDRIYATLLLAEKCGINTLLTNPILCTLIDEYWKRNIGKIQFISDCAGMTYKNGSRPMPFDEYQDKVRRAIDYGASACYIQGETADFYIENGHLDRLEKIITLIQKSGLPAGIGAHRIETIKACVDAGFNPDFWMKTLHHHNYWSAQHPTWKDNMYCFSPEETIAYMENLPQPWIGFKVLAAGAIKPKDGFRYAFENGADFICVGMYDFQMVKNINTAIDVLNSDLQRKRPWRSENLHV